jgi:hypothetical protein
MSTKTTFKRIALVAVAALGLGVLSSVAPASAVAGTITSVTVGASTPARVGSATTTTVTMNWGAAADLSDNDTVTVAARVLTSPAGSAMSGLTAGVADNTAETLLAVSAVAGSTDGLTSHTGNKTTVGALSYVNVYGQVAANLTDETVTSLKAYLSFVPDVAGTYTILVSADPTATAYAAGQKSAIWTITTVGAPASVTLTSINPTVTTSATTGSRIVAVLKDAAGNVTVPTDTETFTVTDSSANSAPSVSSLSNNAFSTLGYAVFYVEDSDNSGATAYTTVVSVAGSGTLSASVNANFTVSFKGAETATADINLGDGETAYGATAATTDAGWLYRADDSYYSTTDGGSVGTIQMTSTANTTASALGTKYYWLTVTDTDGAVTGVDGTVIDVVATQAAAATIATATYTLGTTLAAGERVTIANANDSVLVTGKAPAFSEWSIVTPAQIAAVGSAVSVTAESYDDFQNIMPYQTIAVGVSGRNTVIAKNFVSSATGVVTFSYTDAGTATSALTVDTVAFGSETVAITFGTVTVGTVTVTGGATANTVAYPAVGSTTKAISTAVGGAAGSTTTFTATVKDAGGNLLAGVPVTWSVDKATAGITKTLTADSAACVTGAAGTCTTTVFSWAAPSKVTVTATAGGKTGTGYENFVNAASDARVLSATVSGSLAVAKVVDRYGNVVAGVTVSAKTSNGYFGSGATSTTGVTTEEGTVGFALTGAGTVTLSVDSATYTQTDDAADKVGTTAVTAAVAGTSTGVGASFAPAGVNSVAVEITEGTNSASQAAADAAAEATDAANAATDAANAAAEAADAATAAAQDAADAVAALATQVATYISNLRKQITALTNLVIKIQKKVNA